MLQWGHNFFVMEILIPPRAPLQLPGFNGAITFSLWKSIAELSRGTFETASMGP